MAQLFVGQLPFSKFFPDDLLNLFRPYGSVVAHQLHIHQGNAFVTYATTEEADRAIQALHGKCALGTRSQPIQVMYSKGTRLISTFGLHHRSVCLARNKDRQRSKETSVVSDGVTAADDEMHLGDVMNRCVNPTSASRNVILSPMLCSIGNCHSGTEEQNASFTTLFSSCGDLSGKSEITGDEDSRQLGSVYAAMAASNYHLFQQQQQQQQEPPSYPINASSLVYGNTVNWPVTRYPLAANAAAPGLTPVLGGSALTPSADTSSSSLSGSGPVTYVVMPNSNYPVPCVMPLYYTLPTSNANSLSPQQQQEKQQQQALASALASYSVGMSPAQIAYLPLQPR
ncbi:RNA recognition motif (RRM, RBD, or RNP domain) [Novymonas esmeraldas]|uniref:RNA recognition motif (RRM, RBD, or RNP domain) n=1 Tax=Novymonas esmeraldas TaxID=1808958 RepID=A0AAW0F1R1_9TRYP